MNLARKGQLTLRLKIEISANLSERQKVVSIGTRVRNKYIVNLGPPVCLLAPAFRLVNVSVPPWSFLTAQ